MSQRANAASAPRSRAWPLVVRRARPEDEDGVLAFASRTWDDWDYVPHAWPRWVDARDGVLLVGVVGETAGELESGDLVAVVRVAMPARGEAWLEAIRVDPRVRGMDVATDLQIAELHWAAAQGATIVRYATSSHNEASHRLGARGGFDVIARFRNTRGPRDPRETDEGRGPSGFVPDVQAEAQRRRSRLLDALAATGGLARQSDVARLWSSLAADTSFVGGARLYEPRPWAFEELTESKFGEHGRLGEVVVHEVAEDESESALAVAILVADVAPAEDSGIRLAVLGGAPRAAFELVEHARRLAGEPITFRYPVGAPLVSDVEQRYRERGYDLSDWELHILARPIDDANPLAEIDETQIVLAEPPERIAIPARG